MAFRATDIFTPGEFPKHTYVERENGSLEERLKNALDTPGEIVSVAGPSKSGKTVLVERVVGIDNLITVTGAGVRDPETLWNRVLDWMDTPTQSSASDQTGWSASGGVTVSGEAGVPLLGKANASGRGSLGRQFSETHDAQYNRQGLVQIIREIADSSFVILIDDYHYMPRDVQLEVSRQIKEAARQGVKIVAASVPHRADDVVRSNPELRGRVKNIDLGYWNNDDIKKIPQIGFALLNAKICDKTIEKIIAEISGSPQLMQATCLQIAFAFEIKQAQKEITFIRPDNTRFAQIMQEVASRTDFGSLIRDMHSGPKVRGQERKEFELIDGTTGDVYRTLLLAISQTPARLNFPYNRLFDRMHSVCNGEMPKAASIYQSCYQISRMAEDRSPSERILEWDEDSAILDIVDPYFLFFLRWSEKLKSLAEA